MPKKLDQSYVGCSVSYGTLRDQDLLEAFNSFLRSHVGHTTKDGYLAEVHMRSFLAGNTPDLDTDLISWAINESLFYALNDIAPEGCYFGSNEGDGADFGFWQIEFDDNDF